MSRAKTAALLGMTYETLRAWAADDDEVSDGFMMAEAEGILKHAKNINELANSQYATSANVTASRFYLSTHDREQWAEKQSLELSGTVNITATLAALFAADAGEVPLDGDAG